MNFRDNFQEGNDALMAWFQSALRSARRNGGLKHGISIGPRTIDMDYMADDWTVSLIRIVASADGAFAIKRFAGPRDEAYSEANEWRDHLSENGQHGSQ